MLDGWEAKLNGDTSDAEKRFDAAKKLAAARGFRNLSADRLAAEPIEEIIERFKSISGDLDKPNPREDAALLGAAAPPALRATKCPELYWELARDKIRGNSDDQLLRWRNPRIKAVRNFIAVCGDKPIADITQDDMLDYRGWWMNKIEEEGFRFAVCRW